MNERIWYYRLLASAVVVSVAVFVGVQFFTVTSGSQLPNLAPSESAPRIILPLGADSVHSLSLLAGISRSLPMREEANVITSRSSEQRKEEGGGNNVNSIQPVLQSEGGAVVSGNKPSISAEAAVVEKSDGSVAWGKNSDRRWPSASLTKLMTVAVAATQLPMDLVVRIEDKKLGLSLNGDSRRVLMEGEMYSVKDLIAYALLPSNNEAADALAGAVGRERFVKLMNEKALEWGLINTHYEEPTGLSVLNQSTPTDTARLLLHIQNNHPELMSLAAGGRAQVREHTSGRVNSILSIHKYAATAGFLGGKTGFTYDAKGNLSSLFSVNGSVVAIVVMGSDDREGDTARLLSYIRQTR